MAKTKTTRQRRPKTAYELCERVCEAIAAHPLNYYQGWWRVERGQFNFPSSLESPANECGTAFCRAGWMVQIADRRRPDWSGSRAFELLGSPEEGTKFETDIHVLFNSQAVIGTPGSREYVAEGINGMRRFMRRWAHRLKATPIKPKAERP